MSRYRIVEDSYAGYEVQIEAKHWFFKPCWVQIATGGHRTNTWSTLTNAKAFMEDHRLGKDERDVVYEDE